MKVSVALWNSMTDRIEWMKKWIRLREYDIGNLGETFLYYLYCTHYKFHDEYYGKIQVCNINYKFPVPLSSEELEKKIFAPIEAGGFKRAIKNEEIISKLGISEEEVLELRIGENKRKREQGQKNTEARKKRNNEILTKYLYWGTKMEKLAEEYGLSLRQIKNIIRPVKKILDKRKEDEIKYYYNVEKWSVADIAEWVGRDKDTVNKILERGRFAKKEKVVGEKVQCSYESVTTKIEKVTKTYIHDEYKDVFDEYIVHREYVFTDEHGNALNAFQDMSKHFLVVGEAGCGKSTLTNMFIQQLSPEQRKSTLLLGTTGMSASHIEGTTIHKALDLPLDVITDTEFQNIIHKLEGIEQIVLDEVSMLRVDIATCLFRAIQHIYATEGRVVRLILIGDLCQIPPVCTLVDGNLLHQYYPEATGVRFYDSPYWKELNFERITLKNVYRQDNLEFVQKLKEIKCGKFSAIDWFNDNCSHIEDPDAIYLCTTNKLVDYYNKQALSKFNDDDMIVFQAQYKGNIAKEDMPCDEIIKLAVGMRVMTTVNTKDYKNGNLGTVLKINKKSVRVQLDSGKTVTIKPTAFKLENGIIFKQIGLRIAYAISIHRSQGLSLSKANIDAGKGGFFEEFQLYVALSRVKDFKEIHLLSTLKYSDLKVDKRALEMMLEL